MKRVHQTSPWAVVPVSVLGASLFLALANYALDSGTPPVAKQQPLPALDAYSPQLLPCMESEAAGSAKASRGITTSEESDLRQCLTSSDAVSVLAPAKLKGQDNTGWHPMNNPGAIPARPVALVPTDGYASQARMVEPLPRYGSKAPDLGDMPLVAPAEEETPEPVESAPLGLINSLFLPPGLAESTTDVAPPRNDRPPTQSIEDTWEPLPLLLEPLPIAETGDRAPNAAATVESMQPLPPIDSSLAELVETPVIEDARRPADFAPETIEDVIQPLPPVELGQAEPFERSAESLAAPADSLHQKKTADNEPMPLPPVEPYLTGEIEAPRIADPTGPNQDTLDLPLPLPPIESSLAGTVVKQNAPVLATLPPVEPKLFVPGESLALKMVEGLFERTSEDSRTDPESLTIETEAMGDASGEWLKPEEEEKPRVVADNEKQAPQPLPPVVHAGKNHDAGASESLSPRKYDRSWQLELIAREADKHSHRAFALANKRAYFSARKEFTRALRIVAQGLDTELKTNRHSTALAAGLHALVEAEDFLPHDGHLEAELDLAVIAGAHRTPVLRECDVDDLTPLAAIQKYHTFAQEKLAEAVGREVAGSMALCGLGKLHIAIGNQQRGDGVAAAHPKAMVLLQAALIAFPGNHMASNELGVMLARSGRYADARKAFEHSVATYPTAEAWRNLALTCEQLGEMDRAYQAAQQTLALRGKSKVQVSVTSSGNGTVHWVSPAELANTRGNLHTASASTRNNQTH